VIRAHKLKANKRQERPWRIIFFDVETSQHPLSNGDIEQRFRYGEALYWRRDISPPTGSLERYQIWEKAPFWDWVMTKCRRNSRLVLTSHNLNIDMVALDAFRILPDLGWDLKSLYVKGMVKVIRFRREKCTLLFVDNANWWQVPLASLGDMVGFPKGDLDPTRATLRELIPYCQRDCAILHRVWDMWLSFLDDHNLGNWGMTISAQALKSYTHRFMPHDIFMHDNASVLTLERAAYHGGRVEPFWIGDWDGETRYKLDVNSMYPYVMHRYRYPTKLVAHHVRMHPYTLKRKLRKGLAVARVLLNTPLPVYPITGKHGVYYPVGRFWTTLCTPELAFALAHGHILQVEETAIYTGERIFADYVDFLYPLKAKYKADGNVPYATAVKLMLNSLYGKFGQKGSRDKIVGECDPDLVRVEDALDLDTGERFQYVYVCGQVLLRQPTEGSYNTFVAIAAHVTAQARLYLWELMNLAGRDQVYYVDTDSLMVSALGLSRVSHLLDVDELGALKVEDQADNGYIYGKKDYRLGQHVKLKGVPRTSRQVNSTTFAFDIWPSIRSLLRKGNVSTYYIHPTTRTLKREITWGEKGEGGYLSPLPVST
jgi:hypothetical protein